MRRVTRCLAAAAGAAFWITSGLLPACSGPARRDEPVTEPLSSDDPRVALGHRVFSQHCNQCHPGGAAGLAPAINDKPLPVALMKTQVRKGLGAMPAFSDKEISEEELDGVVRYLKALRPVHG